MSQDSDHRWLVRAGILLLAWEVLALDQIEPVWLPLWLRGCLQLGVLVASFLSLYRWWHVSKQARYAAASLVYLSTWQTLVTGTGLLQASAAQHALSQYGVGGLYVIGLLWLVWYAEQESRRYERERRKQSAAGVSSDAAGAVGQPAESWWPFDPDAWYYGRQRQKVNQSIALVAAYSLLFLLANVLSTLSVGSDSYDLPGGGGGGGSGGAPQAAMAQAVRVQKVVKRKYVINPYSSIKFADRPVDDVKLQLVQPTEHLYTVGFGQGGASMRSRGGVWLRRWRGFGLRRWNGGRQGPLHSVGISGRGLESGLRRGCRSKLADRVWSPHRSEGERPHRVADRGPAWRFPDRKGPPLIYLTGQGSISLSKSEVKTLREYLLDKHGMLFGDNGGSQHFHNQFFSMMRQVLPNVDPVRVPLDDEMYRVPFLITSFPYVAPHGGRDAWGWKVDGRWVCYYHPGDIGDAWSDGHSGVPREVWDACYRLGINVIFYAHVEYSKWLMARHKR